jgi:regulatory protein
VRWLARRDYSRAELTERLRRRGASAADIERALDELAAQGYLCDERYAHAVVAQRKGRYGKRAIVHALKQRGIGATQAEAALAQLAGSDELGEARSVWQQRFGIKPRDEREKARQVRYLQSRGYSLSTALAVMRAAGARPEEES